MRVMVVGKGAREHALLWKLATSPRISALYAAPGNGGTAALAQSVSVSPTDLDGLKTAAVRERIDLVVVGPEDPLALGAVDVLTVAGIPTFGPTSAAAEIESSKVFARDLMQRYNIPCARGEVFDSLAAARAYVYEQAGPIVVKADGLAAGKGVTVCETREQALNALTEAMERRAFGAAGDRVIIEERLHGREASLLAFTDGETVLPMVPARDYKPAFDGDTGPNTGSMGSYSPPVFLSEADVQTVLERILKPAVRALAAEGRPYRGVLYAGLMLTLEGPRVLEFNARFGDPETQVILPRLKSDLVDALEAVVNGRLHDLRLEWSGDPCVGVVMASAGYPGAYEVGKPIQGLDAVDEGVSVFHAGTKAQDGALVTDGGRVLTVAASGTTAAEARQRAYANVERICFDQCHYRKDIAAEAVA